MSERIYGVTDLPVKWESDDGDLLDMKEYLTGLEDFILHCPTPISIAIQGDWGTGKTSILNYLKAHLDDRAEIQTAYFNTWQYSQFDMSQSLYFSFLAAISQEISQTKFQDLAKRLFKFVLSAGKGMLSSAINLDKDQVDEITDSLFERQNKTVQEISKFHDDFAKIVQETLQETKRERLVIFIDDLDRLAPNVAVELLEVMKLFMDVKQCVFVLAVDYEVVVQGVREKYNEDIPLSKCRSFFDKIVQLSFRMPVESYQLDGLVKKYLDKVIAPQYHETLANFTASTMGKNPRAFKRMLNSYLLIRSVYNAKQDLQEADQAALFCCLCIQASSEETYTLLLQPDFWNEDGSGPLLCGDGIAEDDMKKALQDVYPQENRIEPETVAKAKVILEVLPETIGKLYKNQKVGMQKLQDLLQKSSITAVGTNLGTAASSRKTAVKVTRIVLGNEMDAPVTTATDAILQTYTHYLQSNQSQLDTLLERLSAITEDPKKDTGVFRQTAPITVNGRRVLFGKSSSFDVKRTQADQLCAELKLPAGTVQWYDGDQLVYQNK